MKHTVFFLITILTFSCVPKKPELPKTALGQLELKLNQLDTDLNTLEGAQLAQIYCGSCHMFPNPSLLEKHVWSNGVLPDMAYRLGLKNKKGTPFNISFKEQELLLYAQVYSSKPLIDSANWMKILNYYLDNAPDTIVHNDTRNQLAITSQFKMKDFYVDPADNPLTTLVQFDGPSKRIYVGNAHHQLQVLNLNGEKLMTQKFSSPPVDIIPSADGHFQLLTMGEMRPATKKKA